MHAAGGGCWSTRSPAFSHSPYGPAWLQMLRTHLQPYVQAGSVELWDDTTIEAGDDWHQAIAQALDRATVALFLVTPQLLASPFVREQELAPMLQRAAEHNVRLLWVPVVASSYEETPFKRLQAALNPKLPLDQLPAPRQHQELVKLCKRIKALVAA
mgnify:CR=1 FL=1